MPTRERPADRGRRLVRNALGRLYQDLRAARIGAGLSQRAVADAVGVSHSRIGRLERGELERPPWDLLAGACSVVGLDLVVKAYPGGDPLRDRAHAALLERLHRALPRSLRWQTERAFPLSGDQRAWDATVEGSGWRCHVEAETVLSDGQALARRLSLKMRDGGPGHLVLLVADTRRNRQAMAVIRPMLRDALPLDGGRILRALHRGIDPGGSGILLL
jgi:transcriptional regulator with XRE-family HTH domain